MILVVGLLILLLAIIALGLVEIHRQNQIIRESEHQIQALARQFSQTQVELSKVFSEIGASWNRFHQAQRKS